MPRAFLIANPVAGRASPEALEVLLRTFRLAGWRVEWEATRGPGHARDLAAAAVRDGAEAILVMGGDGTTMQAAAAVANTGVPIGLLPGGTGNVLAGNLRLPRTMLKAAEIILEGRIRRVDLGRLTRDDGVHYFGVACGAGADARVMGETATGDKRRLGIGGYFQTLFRVIPELRSTPCVVTVDDQRIETEAAVVLVLNCPEVIPPLVAVRRDAAFDDGWLDVLILSANSPWEVLRGASRTFLNFVTGGGETPYLRYGRGRVVTVEMPVPQPVQYDGDLAGVTPVTAEIQPGALAVFAPTL
ncbi:MAG: diacylglycerol kinase family lipid kinase [Gemmatimonadetes bacterium]|nr:diacylglycerol kinase family lipid kinase [Gemmatimonadota bacterium]